MIALGADHGGFELKEAIKKHLDEKGVEYIDCGTYSAESIDYAPIAKATCEKVTSGECEKAILCCGTGIGISMAANKVKDFLLHNPHLMHSFSSITGYKKPFSYFIEIQLFGHIA